MVHNFVLQIRIEELASKTPRFRMPKQSYLITTLQHPVGSATQSAASEITDIGALWMESSFTIPRTDTREYNAWIKLEPILCFSAKDETYKLKERTSERVHKHT